MTDEKPTGSFGDPPAGAPQEALEPLQPEAVDAMLAKARANERVLPPIVQPTQPPEPAPTADMESPIGGPQGGAVETRGGASSPSTPEAPAPVGPPAAEGAPLQPAASDTDSPSRGMPRPIADPGKVITGGFGDVGEAQYYPLDGSELREVVRLCFDELNERIQTDLRFQMAITYPRASVRVVIEVEGYAEDAAFKIEKRAAPHDKTPIEIARAHGAEEMGFVVRAFRREFDKEGTPESPPDRMRDELGLPKPRKQFVGSGSERMLVDIVPDGDSIL